MFDIEKARRKGIDEKSIKIMEKLNANNLRKESCKGHEFDITEFAAKHTCKNCGYEADILYITGYRDGVQHQKDVLGVE